MLSSSYISPKAVKGQPSMIEGRGLVAVAPITKDEIVAIKGGHIVQIADGFHLVAMREIDPDEELTTDYASFDDHDGEMECRCGTASCRRVINGLDWQRRDLQRRYAEYFSWCLLRRFDRATG